MGLGDLPLTGQTGTVTHLLNVVMDVTEPLPRARHVSKRTDLE